MKALPGLFGTWGRACAKRTNPRLPLRLTLSLGTLVLCAANPAGAAVRHPNILFIIMDDVGIDQLSTFNPHATVSTPNLDTLVHHGVAFNNCWMMPECSPSRACSISTPTG